MTKTMTLKVTVPDDAEEPDQMVEDAIERYCGSVYPVWSAEMAAEVAADSGRPVDYAIVIEKVG